MALKTGTKQKVSVALNSYSIDRAKMLVDRGGFGSMSDVVATALTRFLKEYDKQLVFDKYELPDALKEYLQTEEGRELLTSICTHPAKADDTIEIIHEIE
ncbi:MAG: hypothetical protein ACXQTE_01390 [Methanosarcinaceae archaeon]